MTTHSLLPPGATTFERAIEAATALDARAPAIRPNARAKLDGFDPFVPWLIWEYGLGDILPYLSDPQRALREGIRWQRLRGTPEALRLAFSWRDLDGVQVFQEEPGQHFAAFQIDTNAVPQLEDIDDLIALARLSAPARSRLARIFHGYDLRRIKLDDTRLGDGLLSDYSGVRHTDGQTRLSFGRVFPATVPALEVRTHAGIFVDHVGRAFLPGRFVLSDSRLDDDRATPNPFIYHAHLFTLANADGVPDEPADFEPVRRFQRAQMVLSEGMRLGDINSRTPPVDWMFYEGRRRLSEEAAVSGAPAEVRRTRRTEMFERRAVASALVPLPHATFRWRDTVRSQVIGGRSQVCRLSDTVRQLPPVWYAQPARALAAETYEVTVRVGDAVRADARVAVPERFTPGQVVRADARSVGDALRLIPTKPALALLPDLYDPTASPTRVTDVTSDAAYAGQFWLPLYHVNQPWSEVQVLVGAMHRTDTPNTD
jgi:hypothetical protein